MTEENKVVEINVINWVSYEGSKSYPESVGGMGGWVNGEQWNEFILQYEPSEHPYLEAIRKAVVEKKLRVGGDEHQRSWCPVFSDGTSASFSYRAWGDI